MENEKQKKEESSLLSAVVSSFAGLRSSIASLTSNASESPSSSKLDFTKRVQPKTITWVLPDTSSTPPPEHVMESEVAMENRHQTHVDMENAQAAEEGRHHRHKKKKHRRKKKEVSKFEKRLKQCLAAVCLLLVLSIVALIVVVIIRLTGK